MARSVNRVAWKLFHRFTKLHVAAYRATGGRIGRRFFKGAPVFLLDHVGRKSGARRTTPLIYVRDGDNVVTIASKGGHPRHPAWWVNLRADPETTIQVDGERWAVRAREAAGAERERLWQRAVEVWPSYADYRQRTEREIPVVVLEPAAGGPAASDD